VIVSTKPILHPNNKARIPGSSTIIPDKLVQHVIENYQQNNYLDNNLNKELWITQLNISKAYDRMNITRLVLALTRLKIPSIF